MDAPGRIFPQPGNAYSSLIRYSVASLIILVPFLAAVEDIWAQSLIIFAGALAALSFLINAVRSRRLEAVKSGLNTSIAIFLLMLSVTLIPLPYFLLKIASPAAFHIYRDYGSALNSGRPLFHFGTISLCPYKTLLGTGVIFSFAAVFYLLSGYFDSFRVKLRLANLLILIATIIACWGLANMHIQNKKLFWFREIVSGTPTGPFINTIHFAHFMAMSIPIALGMWIGKINLKNTLLYLAPTAIMAIALFRALSRGAVLAFGVSIAIFIVLLLLKKESRLKAVAAVAAAALLVLLVLKFNNPEMASRIQTLENPLTTDSAITRLSVWKDTLKIFMDFPLFGTGLNTFSSIFYKYKTVFGSGKMFFTHAENDYVETLAEVGTLGFIPLLILVVLSSNNILRNFRQQNDPLRVGMLAGGISSIAAISTGAFTDFVFHIPAIGLTFICIVFISSPELKNSLTLIIDRSSKKLIAFMAITAFVCLMLTTVSIKTFIGQVFFYKFLRAPSGLNSKISYLEKAIYFDGMNADYSNKLGRTYFEEAGRIRAKDEGLAINYIREAKKYFDKALVLDPLNWRYHFDAGSTDYILLIAGSKDVSFAKIERRLNNALELNPTDYDLYNYLVNFYLSIDPEKGLGYCKRLIALRPYFFTGMLNSLWKLNSNPDFIRKAVPDNADFIMKYADFVKARGIKTDRFQKEAADYLINAIEATGYYQKNPEAFAIPSQSMEELVGQSDAITGYSKDFLKRDPTVINKVALFYYQIKDYNRSAGYFRDLVELTPDSIEAKFRYALSLYQGGRYPDAFRVFKEVAQTLILKDKHVHK